MCEGNLGHGKTITIIYLFYKVSIYDTAYDDC